MSRARSLRRTVLKGKGSRNKSSGWRGNWNDRLDIPKAEATPILLTQGEFPLLGREKKENATEDNPDPMAHYHTCLYHGVKLRPRGPGSYYSARCGVQAGRAAGLGDEEDCLPCLREQQGDNRVGGRWLYSFNILHLSLYQRVKSKDKDGKTRRYDKDGENHKRGDAILEWQPVTKPRDRREIMDELDERLDMGEEFEEGGVALLRKKYIEVGRTHRDQITEIDEKASRWCRCGGNLEPVAFSCEHCGEELLDVDEANLDPEEVKRFAEERQRCEHCGEVGLPVPDPECDSCDNPQPLTAFEVVAYVRKAGEGTGTRVEIEKVVRLDEFELPGGFSLLEWEEDDGDEFPAEDDEGNWLFTEDFDTRKMGTSSWNFEKVHAPRGHGFHAHKLGCDVPRGFKDSELVGGGKRGGNRASSKYKNYGKSGRINDDDENEETEESEETPRRRRRRR